MADLDRQNATGLKMNRRLREDAPDKIQAVMSPGKGDGGLVPVLRGQRTHDGFSHVRRIRDDEIVATPAKSGVQIRPDEPHAAAEPIIVYVAPRDSERVGGNIDRVDMGAGERDRGEDGEAARSRA